MNEMTPAQKARVRAESYNQRMIEKLLDQIRDNIVKSSDDGEFECVCTVGGDYSQLIVDEVIRLLRMDGFEAEELFFALIGEVSKDIKIKINW